MMKGLWYYRDSYDEALKLAVRMGANTIFVKAAYQPGYPNCTQPPQYLDSFRLAVLNANASGLLVCAEAYIVPQWASEGGALLKRALEDGANSVCLNAETEWESVDGVPAQKFLAALGPGQLHLCSDIRGNRLTLPYHRTLWPQLAGVHPMCYHRAFRPGNPMGALQQCFDDTLGNLQKTSMPIGPNVDVPIYPVVQGYDGCDYEETLGAVILSHLFDTDGSSVYVSHDLNKRAELGVRDGWAIVEKLRIPTNPVIPFVGGLTAEQKTKLVEEVQEVLKNY